MSDAQLKTIYRYPVKSMGGHTLNATLLTAKGIPGDRCWALQDDAHGGIKGGKRFPAIMGMSAELLDTPSQTMRSPPVKITLSNGSTLLSDDQDANDRLSDAVGSPVSLWPLLPEDQLAHYKRTPPPPGTDPIDALRQVFGRTPDEPLPDLKGFPEVLIAYESPPGTYFDAYPLLILSESSMAALTTSTDQSNFDVRRFRPNLLISINEVGFPEDQWAGREAKLGGARLKLDRICPRCIMTTHGFADLPKDPKIMRQLVQQNGGNLGLYASVVEPGEITLGDTLELI